MQVLPAHVQPVPVIETKVKADGTVSVTVTGPMVGEEVIALLTVTV